MLLRFSGGEMYGVGIMDGITLVVSWLILGAIIGWFAHVFVQSRDEHSQLVDMGVGVVGALFAGVVFAILDMPRTDNYTAWSVVSAFIGACLLLSLYRMYTNVPSSRGPLNF